MRFDFLKYSFLLFFYLSSYAQINCFDSSNKKGYFEYSNTTDSDFTNYWTKSSTGTFSIETTNPYHDLGSLKVVVPANNLNNVHLSTTSNCTGINVTNSQVWNISAYILAEVGDQLKFSLVNPSDGSVLGSVTHTVRYKPWHYIRLKITSSAAADNAQLKINFHHDGNYFIDNVVLEQSDINTWYVSPSGNNSNDGTSLNNPKADLWGVISDSDFKYGEIINFRGGDYNNSGYYDISNDYANRPDDKKDNDYYFKVPNSNRADFRTGTNTNLNYSSVNRTIDRPLVIRNYVDSSGSHEVPFITFDGAGGFMFGSQSQRVKFLEIGGFKIRGPNSHITYAAAKAHRDAAVTAKGNGSWNASNTPDDLFRGRGIVIWGGSFLNIHSNEVYETPNSGIRVNNADYVRLVNNKVYKTTWWSYNAESGIVIAQSLNHENVTNQDGAGANNVAANTVGIIKMRIENNVVYENINKLVFFNSFLLLSNILCILERFKIAVLSFL